MRDPLEESGFTMLAVTAAMAVVMMLAVAAVAAVNGDMQTTRRDLDQKRALEAAKAGINDYVFHLTADASYWSKCTNVEEPSAVNPYQSSTATPPLPKRLSVPGETGATYALELIPAKGKSACVPTNLQTAKESMLEVTENPGSFRIRSWGFSGPAKTSVVATFKPPSFLDYVYSTQLETLDPLAYGFPNPSPELSEAEAQCNLTYNEGRYNKPFKVLEGETYKNQYCSVISFVTGDSIKGPFHTNDSIAINGKPSFGRTAKDQIEVGGSPPGWYAVSGGSEPTFVGKYLSGAPRYYPPSSNLKLSTIAASQFRYTGQVKICLSGENMTVGKNGTCTGVYSGKTPTNGVVWVGTASTGCNEIYSPFKATYPATSGCGNAYVSGNYSSELTIAAQNNVIINGSLVRSGEGLLGLIANNFIRVYHPCAFSEAEVKAGELGKNEAGSLENPTIDAAMLSIQHSFIVDHYDCGKALGTLTMEGAIAQKFRGPVGTSGSKYGSTGYLKNYLYDDRLHYQEPPAFIEPVQGGWVLGRLTVG